MSYSLSIPCFKILSLYVLLRIDKVFCYLNKKPFAWLVELFQLGCKLLDRTCALLKNFVTWTRRACSHFSAPACAHSSPWNPPLPFYQIPTRPSKPILASCVLWFLPSFQQWTVVLTTVLLPLNFLSYFCVGAGYERIESSEAFSASFNLLS